MTALATVPEEAHDLRTLVDRASSALADARNAAEVLDARDMAGLAYDVAKRTARLQRAKAAHDDLIAAAHRSQARGEVQRHGRQVPRGVADHNIPSTADLGLRRDQIHEARLIRAAESADPGIVRRTLDEHLARGEEPTRAALRRAAQDRLQRSLNRFKSTEESVRRFEADIFAANSKPTARTEVLS